MKLTTRRFFAAFIDWTLIAFVGAIVLELLQMTVLQPTIKSYITVFLIVILVLGKDIVFKNASIGKKIFRLRVVSTSNSDVTSIGRLILRNVPLVWGFPIEFIMFWRGKKRLGDIWSETEVIIWKNPK